MKKVRISPEGRLFLQGIKPAWLISNKNTHLIQHIQRKGFPFIEWKETHSFLFFKNEKLKREFEQNPIRLGKVLGYPPQACRFFQERQKKTEEKVHICYHGMTFTTSKYTAKEDVEWLFEHMPIPSFLQTKITLFKFDEETKETLFFFLIEKVEDIELKLKKWERK